MNDKIKQFLEDELKLLNNLHEEGIIEFFHNISKYIEYNKPSFDKFCDNIRSLKSMFEKVGLTEREIIKAINNNPSYIHANKSDLSLTFSLLSVVQNSKTGKYVKKDIIINHGQFLRTECALIYARIKHIMYLINSNSDILRHNFITTRKVIKITNNEFEDIYKISKEDLLKRYPLDLEEIKLWDEIYLKALEQEQERERIK